MKPRLSVIIPFLNESENISGLTQSLSDFFGQIKDYAPTVIFVNDGSSDNSVDLLRHAHHKNYHAKVVSLTRNYGSHAALRAGIFNAEADFVCFIYADLQDPLILIDQMYELCNKKNDIVWATRQDTQSGFFEGLFSKFYAYLMRKYAISNYPTRGFDIVMFNRKVQESINKNIESNSSIFLQMLMLGYRQATVHYRKESRKKGKSKWTVKKKIKLLVDSFVAFSYAPIRFVTFIGILLFLTGMIWTTYIVGRKIIYNDLESGWPALVSILTIGFGITNISLGIIAEYLWRTLDSARRRPVFIVDEVIDLNHNAEI